MAPVVFHQPTNDQAPRNQNKILFAMFRCVFVFMVLSCMLTTSAFRSMGFTRRVVLATGSQRAAATIVPPSTPPTPAMPPPALKNFYQVSQPEFVETMKSWSQPAFRAKQVWGWVYDKGVVDFNEMNDLPVALREKLHGHYTVGDLRLASEQVSKVSAPSTPSPFPHTDIAAPFHTASHRTCRRVVCM